MSRPAFRNDRKHVKEKTARTLTVANFSLDNLRESSPPFKTPSCALSFATVEEFPARNRSKKERKKRNQRSVLHPRVDSSNLCPTRRRLELELTDVKLLLNLKQLPRSVGWILQRQSHHLGWLYERSLAVVRPQLPGESERDRVDFVRGFELDDGSGHDVGLAWVGKRATVRARRGEEPKGTKGGRTSRLERGGEGRRQGARRGARYGRLESIRLREEFEKTRRQSAHL